MKRFTFLSIIVILINHLAFGQTQLTLLANWDDNTLPVKSGLSYNDCWGYAAGNGREYAIMGSLTKVHFFEIATANSPSQTPLVTVTAEFTNGANSIWRDFKTYSHFAYAVADEGGEGLLVFDLNNINNTSNRVTQIHQNNTTFLRCHNIYIDEPNRKLYCAGTNSTNGLVVFDINAATGIPTLCAQIPLNINGFTSGYIHDVFVKNAKIYCSHGTNGLRIYDGTAINAWQTGNSVITTMPLFGTNNMVNSGYNHSSWLNTAGTHLIMAEETHGKPLKILDVSDPTEIGNFSAPTSTFQSCMLCPTATNPIVHNPFVKGNLVFLSYYHEGIQVYDISNPASPFKVAFYDTEPNNIDYSGYEGAWGTYPFLPSQRVIGSDVTNGLFILGLPAALLPATLVNFNANIQDENILLSWKTGVESENMIFEVEKSKNGVDFISLNAQNSKNRNGAQYFAKDEQPFIGKNYYRLKQIDHDGKFEYSKIIEVDFNKKIKVNIFPNPSENGTFYIDFAEKKLSDEIFVEIMDLQGRLIFSAENFNSTNLTVSNLQKGVYLLKIKQANALQIEKIIVN